MKKGLKPEAEKSKETRIAIVNSDRCKPKNCGQPCKKSCPVVKTGKQCIVVEASSKIAEISEILCIGCGICVKKCPYGAITIIKVPSNLDKDTSHRYGPNSFKLHRLPTPRRGKILGLVGTNGIGKSTALKILAGKCKPNLGNFKNPPDWEAILENYRGSELQNYFNKILENKLKVTVKPQYVDQIPKQLKNSPMASLKVGEILKRLCDRGPDILDKLVKDMELEKLLNREVEELSGGELQRFAIATAAGKEADVYMFDEPSSYLDVRQRLEAARLIRELSNDNNYVVVVEHDLAVLDYLSDYTCLLYGVPAVYGVVTTPFSVLDGLNIFLDGFIPNENMRFRDEPLSFKVVDQLDAEAGKRMSNNTYPDMTYKVGDFELTVEKGHFTDSEIVVLLGENGTGKTTFIKLMAGQLKPSTSETEIPELAVSYKPQKITSKFEGTVQQLLLMRIPAEIFTHSQFKSDVLEHLKINELLDKEMQYLSGGELQRVALTLCLGKPANVYLIDEPSAYLDAEQRLNAAKVIKRFILHAKKTAFIVEHDFIMSTYLADQVIVFEGEPARKAVARSPQSLLDGMNCFLRSLNITFRRENLSHRPRINKKDSQKDQDQKSTGNYFFMDDVGTASAKARKA